MFGDITTGSELSLMSSIGLIVLFFEFFCLLF